MIRVLEILTVFLNAEPYLGEKIWISYPEEQVKSTSLY